MAMVGNRQFLHHTLSESSSGASEMSRPDSAPPTLPPRSAPSSRRQLSWRTRWCDVIYLLPTRLAAVLLALVQGGVLDCYLIHYNSTYWFAWIAGDVAVFMMFVGTFIVTYRQMARVMRRLLGRTGSDVGENRCVGNLSMVDHWLGKEGGEGLVASPPGYMPVMYFAWLVYSSMLAIRVLLIYKNFAHELEEGIFLGKNMLQVVVASASVVFLFLLFAHHDAYPDSCRRQRIDNLTYLVLFDLIDAADLLSVLSNPVARKAMEPWVTWCVLGVACSNLLLPTLPLMTLSRTRFGTRILPEYLQTLHRLLVLLGVNAPMLGIRLFLWQYLKLPVSTFIVKNVAVSFLVFYSFYERDHYKRLQKRLLDRQADVLS